jgi:thymidylate synthase (FAD)
MKLIKSKAELIWQGESLDDLFKHIEACGRVPYKSEAKSDGTIECAMAFVEKMIKSRHNAVLEHGTVYLHCFGSEDELKKYSNNSYSAYKSVYDHKEVCQGDVDYYSHEYVTTNYRVLVENGWLDDLKYICAPTEHHVKRYTFKVLTSIGVTREFNRHRKNSILEMSTRYCNFSTDKFDNQVSFCKPSWLDLNLGTYERVDNNKDLGDVVGDGYIKNVSNRDEDNLFLTSCLFAEDTYKELLEDGWKPQQAREILPLCTATEVVYTGFAADWKHFFNLRFFETTGKVHPNMMELSTKMKEECEKAGIWNNIIKDNNEN